MLAREAAGPWALTKFSLIMSVIQPWVMVSLIALAPELRPKSSYINDFVKYSIEALADLDVPVSVDVFGLTTSVRGDMGIGQNFQ